MAIRDARALQRVPEPLLGGKEREALRWCRLRIDRLVLEDSRDLLNISDANAFRTLIELLPERVGSLLSINALYEDVGKAYATVRSWLQVLDALYFSFTIRPYAGKLACTLKAEPKLYFLTSCASRWKRRAEGWRTRRLFTCSRPASSGPTRHRGF
jgi:predicted AAA+ superfamily ATPase